MVALQLPDDLLRTIEQQVAAGRVPSMDAFLWQAVARYAEALDAEADGNGQAEAANSASDAPSSPGHAELLASVVAAQEEGDRDGYMSGDEVPARVEARLTRRPASAG